MLPSPTPEAFLIMAGVAALTDDLSTRKCSRFRWAMRDQLGADNPKVRLLRHALPALDEAREGAITVLLGSCAICQRRGDCRKPVV